MRLIDADQLKELILKERDAIPKTISERYGFDIGRPNNHGNSMRGGIRKALRCMEKTPTVKIETVKHGKWTVEEVPLWIVKGKVVSTSIVCVCSACGRKADTKTKYCSNCGSKMDGE